MPADAESVVALGIYIFLAIAVFLIVIGIGFFTISSQKKIAINLSAPISPSSGNMDAASLLGQQKIKIELHKNNKLKKDQKRLIYVLSFSILLIVCLKITETLEKFNATWYEAKDKPTNTYDYSAQPISRLTSESSFVQEYELSSCVNAATEEAAVSAADIEWGCRTLLKD